MKYLEYELAKNISIDLKSLHVFRFNADNRPLMLEKISYKNYFLKL